MKLVALAILTISAAASLGLGACSINHRSGDFACTAQADCATGKVCSDGFCVAVDSGGVPDARVSDGGQCPAQCTSCDTGSKTCVVDCAVNPATCNQQINCPAGWSCKVACSTASSCRSGVSCAAGKACDVTCSGSQSCRNVTCGTGACTVDCSGPGSCRNVSCGLACACDVTCAPGSTCQGLACKSLQCTVQLQPFECTSKTAGCNSCM